MITSSADTIAAIATPPGRGGVGIIRVSGRKVAEIAQALCGELPKPRFAKYADFRDQKGLLIDQGIALYFPNPHSFTGEDVLELQGHGGVIVQDNLLQRVIELGARLAKPGEFSERAFLNDKLDLTQAEAIADLIDATSTQAARAAMRSLQGEFSAQINQLVTGLIQLRMYVEAAIDFPEEEIDFLSDKHVSTNLQTLLKNLQAVQATAQQGSLLREGMTVVIAGKPNAGKSSLLNALSGRETAIVTDIPGTTRDVLRDAIQIDGLPLHIIDTAGLRESIDQVEQEGIRRAHAEIANADQVLLVIDAADADSEIDINKKYFSAELKNVPENKITLIYNKIDLLTKNSVPKKDQNTIFLSAKTGAGLELLRNHLKSCMGYHAPQEGTYTARRRHLTALSIAEQALINGQQQLATHRAGELLAEDLRHAQHALGEITGEFTSDDLLGQIFSNFCIGK